MAAIGINAVAIAIENRHAFDVHEIATEQADVVIGRIPDGDVADGDVTAILQRNGFRPLALGPVAVNAPGADDTDMLHVLPPQQRIVEIRRLVVGK